MTKSKEYYQKNKEKWKIYNSKPSHNEVSLTYYHKNKLSLKEKKQKWDEDNYEYILWSQTKRRARYSGLEWALDKEDIVIPDVCPLLNLPLTRTQGKGVIWTNASVDRVDNSKGYTKDNIQIISRLANSMKQHATKEQLLLFAKNILKQYENS